MIGAPPEVGAVEVAVPDAAATPSFPDRVRLKVLALGRWFATGGGNETRRKWFAALPWLLLVLMVARSLPGLVRANDFAVYYAAGEAVVLQQDIFESAGLEVGRKYIYPPTLAVLVSPLSFLPFQLAAVLWGLLNGAVLVLSFRKVRQLLRVHARAEWWTVGLVTSVLFARPLDSELGNGQANLLVIASVLCGLVALQSGRSLRGGVWLALAACLKVTPALFVGYLILRRQWTALMGWALGAALFLLLLPALAYLEPLRGAQDTAEWARRVAAPVLATSTANEIQAASETSESPEEAVQRERRRQRRAEIAAFDASFAAGHSLRALSYRYFSRAPLSYRDRENPRFVTVANLGRPFAQKLFGGMAVCVLLVTVLVCGFRRARAPSLRMALEVSVWLSAMLLISPVSRKAHFVAMLLGFACLAVRFVRRPRSGAGWWIVACLACYLLSASAVTGETGSLIFRSGGLYTATAFLPWLALGWMCWKNHDLSERGAPSTGVRATPR